VRRSPRFRRSHVADEVSRSYELPRGAVVLDQAKFTSPPSSPLRRGEIFLDPIEEGLDVVGVDLDGGEEEFDRHEARLDGQEDDFDGGEVPFIDVEVRPNDKPMDRALRLSDVRDPQPPSPLGHPPREGATVVVDSNVKVEIGIVELEDPFALVEIEPHRSAHGL
jgi:hypothetical protein